MIYEGVDTSSNNNGGTGLVDFQAVKKAGKQFAMVRVGYGTRAVSGFTGYISKSFAPQVRDAQSAGLDTGVYWYSNATTVAEAEIEAEACLRAIGPFALTYPIAFDQEYENAIMALSRQQRTDIALAFLRKVQSEGYYPMMYASKDWFENWIFDDQLKDFAHWVAQYAPQLTYKGDAGIWQYSGSGSIPGVTGAIDLNKGYQDYPKIIREGGYNHLQPITPVPPETDYQALYEQEKQKNDQLIAQLKALIAQYE